MEIIKATSSDLQEILNLQKIAYQSEAEIVGDYTIAPLTQTLDGIREDFESGVILKAVESNEIIGSVRVYVNDNTLHICRLIVSPEHQNKGIGTALLRTAESLFPEKRLELFTSEKSDRNLYLYKKNGYKEFKREPMNENIDFVFMEKHR